MVYKEEFPSPPPSISTIDYLYGSGIFVRLIILSVPGKFVKREKKVSFCCSKLKYRDSWSNSPSIGMKDN